MKKSVTLLTLAVGLAAGVGLAQFLPPRASAQSNAVVSDDGITALQALQGQQVSIGSAGNGDGGGAWQGKLVSINGGWITLDSPGGSDAKPIIRIPLTRVLCICSAK